METFIHLRPVFMVLIVASAIFSLSLVILKREKVNGWTVFIMTATILTIGSVCLYASGSIVDEFAMGGDPMSFYLYLALFPVSLLNVLIYCFKPARPTDS